MKTADELGLNHEVVVVWNTNLSKRGVGEVVKWKGVREMVIEESGIPDHDITHVIQTSAVERVVLNGKSVKGRPVHK